MGSPHIYAFQTMFSGINAFPPERAVIIKERAVKSYPVSAYFFAKWVAQLPLVMALPLLFSAFFYFMSGLELSFFAISLYLIILFFNVTLADSIGLFFGAWQMDLAK